jgi:hypothetical protein
MAPPGPPAKLVEHHPWGTSTRRVNVRAYVRHPDGQRQVRVAYDDLFGDGIQEVVQLADLRDVIELPGVDYGSVPVVEAETARGGRVPTGHEWRRTG